MPYYANMEEDQPSAHKRKRIVFYRRGLKIYSLLPYILQRRLHAQFFSSTITGSGVRISAGSFEANWTAISYQNQSPEAVEALMDWLFSGAGFKAAIASEENWDDDIFSGNFFNYPPDVWHPVGAEARPGYITILKRLPATGRDEIVAVLLSLPAPSSTAAPAERQAKSEEE
jgi:hypothetical protein